VHGSQSLPRCGETGTDDGGARSAGKVGPASAQSIKFVYSTGATTRRGSDFNTFNVTWQLVTF